MAYYENSPIDPVSSKKEKDRYAQIRAIEAYLQELDSLEIEDIILKISEQDSKNQLNRKIVLFSARALMQNLLEKTSQEKAKMYQEAAGTSWQAMQAACQVLAATSSPYTKAIFDMSAGACASSAGAAKESLNARISVHDHLYQSTQTTRQDYDQGKQSAENALEQLASLMDRVIQTSRRVAEAVNS